MSIVVQKYGGSSVADLDKIGAVADRIVETAAQGHQVVVTVSAMGDTTDELLDLAKRISPTPSRRELDMLLTAGERISMALLSMAIHERGRDAVSLTGSQSGIITNDQHSGARIVEIRPFRIQDELARGRIVIVAGYQGVSYKREVTTLGRGGTDTTAVALAAALGAQWCEICSDVDGIYTADPRVVEDAQRIPELSFEETQEMADAGARVLNAQAVEFAKERGIAIYARATVAGNPGAPDLKREGTVVRKFPPNAPGRVRAVVSEELLWLVRSAAPAETLERFDAAGIGGKQLFAGDGELTLVIPASTVPADFPNGFDVTANDSLSAVSLIGVGINDSHANLRRGLQTLNGAGISVELTATSSFRITYLLTRTELKKAVQSLHREFIEETGPAVP